MNSSLLHFILFIFILSPLLNCNEQKHYLVYKTVYKSPEWRWNVTTLTEAWLLVVKLLTLETIWWQEKSWENVHVCLKWQELCCKTFVFSQLWRVEWQQNAQHVEPRGEQALTEQDHVRFHLHQPRRKK